VNLPTVLILCTGNSCRSQMAEGYMQHLAGDRFKVLSAGTTPSDHVHPLAIQVMAEEGVDISGHSPKNLREYLGRVPVRFLIIVCGGAQEACPRIWPGIHERLFWPFDDPAAFKGTESETLAEFRRVRDQIRSQIEEWLAETR